MNQQESFWSPAASPSSLFPCLSGEDAGLDLVSSQATSVQLRYAIPSVCALPALALPATLPPVILGSYLILSLGALFLR